MRVHLYMIKIFKFKEETKSIQLTLELLVHSDERFLLLFFFPPALNSPFIRGQMGVDLLLDSEETEPSH